MLNFSRKSCRFRPLALDIYIVLSDTFAHEEIAEAVLTEVKIERILAKNAAGTDFIACLPRTRQAGERQVKSKN